MMASGEEKAKAFHAQIDQEAERLIGEELPKKILSLGKVYDQIREDRKTKAYEMKREVLEEYVRDQTKEIPINSVVMNAIRMLGTEIVSMLEELNTIRTWIRLNMPKMEPGGNVGTEVRMEVLGMLDSLYGSGLGFIRNLTSYHCRRAKLLTDMRKRPHVKDYIITVLDLDEKQYVNIVQSCGDLRNNYAFVHDKIVKNRSKLEKQKVTMSVNMY